MFTALDARRQPPAEVNLLFAHLQRGGDAAPKEELRAGEYVCKHCGQPLRPRFPLRRRWHFYHVQGASACPYGAGESEEHRWLKYQLVEQWSRRYKIPLERFRLEHPLAVGDSGRAPRVRFDERLPPAPHRTARQDPAGVPYGLLMFLYSGMGLYYLFWVDNWGDEIPSEAVRRYDQIPMLGSDLLEQVLRVAPDLAGRSVAFVSDYDGTSLLHAQELLAGPARMLLLAFDERPLISAREFAALHGFGSLLDTRLYNVFRAVPAGLAGGYEVFYTNPPLRRLEQRRQRPPLHHPGLRAGRAGRRPRLPAAAGHPRFPWSQRAMSFTRGFLRSHGWRVVRAERDLHRYPLGTVTDDEAAWPPHGERGRPVAVVEPTREGATALKVGHATWIFQANPALYDIHRLLKLEAREWWGCLQHTGRIRAGDRVLIWMHRCDRKAVTRPWAAGVGQHLVLPDLATTRISSR